MRVFFSEADGMEEESAHGDRKWEKAQELKLS